MNYGKPSIEVLGDAVRVIQSAKQSPDTDSPMVGSLSPNPPAYELDE